VLKVHFLERLPLEKTTFWGLGLYSTKEMPSGGLHMQVSPSFLRPRVEEAILAKHMEIRGKEPLLLSGSLPFVLLGFEPSSSLNLFEFFCELLERFFHAFKGMEERFWLISLGEHVFDSLKKFFPEDVFLPSFIAAFCAELSRTSCSHLYFYFEESSEIFKTLTHVRCVLMELGLLGESVHLSLTV